MGMFVNYFFAGFILGKVGAAELKSEMKYHANVPASHSLAL